MKSLLKQLLRNAGFEVRRVAAAPPMPALVGLDVLFPVLQRLGFNPRHIVDVGANRGKWTRKAMEYFPEAHYTLIEPQEQLRESVQDLIDSGHKVKWISAGAGDSAGTLKFTLLERVDSRTFSISVEAAEERGFRQVEVPVRTLNEMLSSDDSYPIRPDLVKIDAEGFDLRVLAGASELLGNVELFALEALVGAKDYENTILKVMTQMSGLGYDLFDITDMNRSPLNGVLWLCELVFIRRGSPLMAGVDTYE